MSRILVVDDNELNLKLACIALEMAGHECLKGANGREAVEIAGSEQPDIVLMDLRMPVMNGDEALKRIKADTRTGHIPVVVLTAHAMKGMREKLLADGFDGYIDKPIDVKTFAETVVGFIPGNREGS